MKIKYYKLGLYFFLIYKWNDFYYKKVIFFNRFDEKASIWVNILIATNTIINHLLFLAKIEDPRSWDTMEENSQNKQGKLSQKNGYGGRKKYKLWQFIFLQRKISEIRRISCIGDDGSRKMRTLHAKGRGRFRRLYIKSQLICSLNFNMIDDNCRTGENKKSTRSSKKKFFNIALKTKSREILAVFAAFVLFCFKRIVYGVHCWMSESINMQRS